MGVNPAWRCAFVLFAERGLIENGKVYEALVYAWLERNEIPYMPQHYVAREDCFKTSFQGYDADGILKESNIVFDVKQFGLV